MVAEEHRRARGSHPVLHSRPQHSKETFWQPTRRSSIVFEWTRKHLVSTLLSSTYSFHSLISPLTHPFVVVFRCELGDLPKAREYFDEALSIGTEIFGNNHPNVAQSLHNLGTLPYPLLLSRLPPPHLLPIPSLSAPYPLPLCSLSLVGVLCLKQEQWTAAHDFCERARTIRVDLFGHHHVDVAASLSVLGTVLMQVGKLDLALTSFTKAHSVQSELLGSVHPEVATTLQNLGVLHKRLGNLPEGIYPLSSLLSPSCLFYLFIQQHGNITTQPLEYEYNSLASSTLSWSPPCTISGVAASRRVI